MARTKKDVTTEEKLDEVVVNDKTAPKADEKIPANVEKLMRLNPQYESFYVTSNGFVHPIGAPEYLIKDAQLYKNKYFKS